MSAADYYRWWFLEDAKHTDDYCVVECEWIDSDGILCAATSESIDEGGLHANWATYQIAGEPMGVGDREELSHQVGAWHRNGSARHYEPVLRDEHKSMRTWALAGRLIRHLEQQRDTARDVDLRFDVGAA